MGALPRRATTKTKQTGMTKRCDPEPTNPSQRIWKGTKKVINWKKGKLGIPRRAQKPKESPPPSKRERWGRKSLQTKEQKRTMWSIKRVENLAESAILVGEKPTEATVSGITEITPVKSLSRPAELQSQNQKDSKNQKRLENWKNAPEKKPNLSS